jgi:hypothetical protein
MKGRQIAMSFVLTAVAGCASFGGGGGVMGPKALKKGTIELYRKADDTCRTNTTPFFSLKKGSGRKVAWEIKDESDCLADGGQVQIQFKGGANQDLLPNCNKNGNAGRKKIECDLSDAGVIVGTSEYNVVFGQEVEDPVLQIEQF